MNEIKELTCISCPMGCNLEVVLDGQSVIEVKGYTCKRGEEYGRKECTNPTRIVTTTISVDNGVLPVVSVKTNRDIPKGKIFSCINELKNIKIKAPVHIGDVIVPNILGTGSDIVATMDVAAI